MRAQRSLKQPPLKASAQPLLVAQKMEAVIAYGYTALRDFPRAERHVSSQEIRISMWSALRGLILVSKRRKPTGRAETAAMVEALRALDADLELLRRQIRMTNTLGLLPMQKYEVWMRHLNEVGAIVGAWLTRLDARLNQVERY
ncbi:MAG: diversity-generating retroelement protein Avd [Gammaproteobacteria bacterium]|nr:diversity-generating retroelement protein Avd [Gammaproteobacteria bacterium]